MNKKLLCFSSLFFSLISYGCTETSSCEKGKDLFRLLCSHLSSSDQCITPVEELENVSNQMKSLECDSFVNGLIILKYAHYLCSSYSVKYGIGCEVYIDNQDFLTLNYIKGLDLYGQIISKDLSLMNKVNFNFYMKKLKTKEQSFNNCLELFDNNSIDEFNFNFFMKILKEKEQIFNYNDYIKSKETFFYDYNNILNKVIKNIIFVYKELEILGKEDLLYGFSHYIVMSLHQDETPILICKISTALSEEVTELSDNLKLAYARSLGYSDIATIFRNYFTRNITFRDKNFANYYSFKHRHSKKEQEYLLERINNGKPFKNKFLEDKFYELLGENYQYFKNHKEAVKYFEHALPNIVNLQILLDFSKAYFELKNYQRALEIFEIAQERSVSNNEDKKRLRRENPYYFFLLDKTNNKARYDEVVSQYNQDILEKHIQKNKSIVEKAKKYLKYKAKEEKIRLEKEAEQLTRKLKETPILVDEDSLKKKDVFEHAKTISTTYLKENLKKEYRELSIKRKKTHGIAVPPVVVEAPIVAEVNIPKIRAEEKLENNPYKIFCRLFDNHFGKFHPEELETLFKALKFPFSRSDGKGDHMKGVLLSRGDDGKEIEEMVIIPYRVEIGPYYIKSLCNSFIRMGLYPDHLENDLKKKGLIK